MKNKIETKILNAALLAAEERGYQRMTRSDVAKYANLPPSNVQYYFRSIHELRAKTLRWAIEQQNLIVLAQGLVMRDKIVMNLTGGLRMKVIDFLKEKV
jgi:AcrR family transcriptional regulator